MARAQPIASPALGSIVTCAETGKAFTVARDGCSFNYATTRDGQILSDEGVDIRERRELLNRAQPFVCYVSSDGKHVTGWKGNVLGMVHLYAEHRTGWNGSTQARFRVMDVHGQMWSGRGAGRGMVCTLRAMKAR